VEAVPSPDAGEVGRCAEQDDDEQNCVTSHEDARAWLMRIEQAQRVRGRADFDRGADPSSSCRSSCVSLPSPRNESRRLRVTYQHQGVFAGPSLIPRVGLEPTTLRLTDRPRQVV
jgi:hypothetical protein